MNSKHILFVSPPFAGHTNILIVLAQEMLSRGHQVSFATSQIFKKRINEAGLEFFLCEPESAVSDPDLLKRFRKVWKKVSQIDSILKGERLILDVLADMYKPMYDLLVPIFDELQPTLVVADGMAVPAIDLARLRKIPVVVVDMVLGRKVPVPSGLPRFGTNFPSKMNLWQRFLNWLHPLNALFHLFKPAQKLKHNRERIVGSYPFTHLYTHNPLLVPNSFAIEVPRIMPPNVFLVGPIIPRKIPDLPSALNEWLRRNQHKKVVYVSFGTLAVLSTAVVKALIDGLASPDYEVLWSIRDHQHEVLPPLPSNFLVMPFVPQLAVLANSAVKAFVSHCGMNSVTESLYYGKPILAIPMFGDQHYNAVRVSELGAGIKLDKGTVRPEEIKSSLQKILSEKKYTESAQRIGLIQKYCAGLDRAADCLEYGVQLTAFSSPACPITTK